MQEIISHTLFYSVKYEARDISYMQLTALSAAWSERNLFWTLFVQPVSDAHSQIISPVSFLTWAYAGEYFQLAMRLFTGTYVESDRMHAGVSVEKLSAFGWLCIDTVLKLDAGKQIFNPWVQWPRKLRSPWHSYGSVWRNFLCVFSLYGALSRHPLTPI